MKKSLLSLASICTLWLMNGCGSAPALPPPAVSFTVTSASSSQVAGVAFNLSVTAVTASGQTATGYSGTVHFICSDVQSTFPANPTMSGGIGTFSVTLGTVGPHTITVADTGSLTGTSGTITVSAAPAFRLAVVSATTTASTGTPFNFTVTALDPYNNTVTTYPDTVHFTSTDPQAVLPADSKLTNGTGNFSATSKTSGAQTITATDTTTASITGSTGSVAVSGPATHFSFAAPGAASTRKSFNLTVSALDASNNVSTGYTGTIQFSSTDPSAILPAKGATLAGGVKAFTVTLETAGNPTITVADTGTSSISGTSAPIAVTLTPPPTISSATPPNGTVGLNYGPTNTIYEKCVPVRRGRGCTPCVPDTRAGCNAPTAPDCTPTNTNLTCIETLHNVGFELTATGGISPFTWTASSLPPGLAITSQYGHIFISGTPPPGSAGTYNATVTLNDAGAPPAPMTAPYTITIAAPPLLISSTNLPDGVIGTAYNATLASSGGTPPVTWSVTAGALPAGLTLNSTTGAITGTPSTAQLANFTVQAADTGTPQQTKTQAMTITVNPPAVNNAELKGQYSISFQGFDASGPVTMVGSFTADGAGNLTGGLRDVNRVTGVTASQTFFGTYGIYADNRGNFSVGTIAGASDLGSFRISLGSLVSGVATKARFVEFDASATRGAGIIELQDPTAFATAKITGDYAFGGSSPISSTANFGIAGRFTAAAGTMSSCSFDEDSQGTLKTNATFTGTYAVAATGRATLVLNVTGSTVPVNIVAYVVSSGELMMMSSDLQTVNPLFVGRILQQTGAGTFSNTSLNSASIMQTNGLNVSGTTDVVLVVLTIPSAGNFTLAGDENNGGTVQALNQAGTYAVTARGRGTITGTTHPEVFYLVGPNEGFIVGTDANATTGFFEPQTGAASASGAFFLGATSPLNVNVTDESGEITFNGTGSVTGTTDSSMASGLFPDQAFTDTYTIAANGRGKMTATSIIFYLISPSKMALMSGTTGASNSSILIGEK